jgi:hypothetical protein
MPVGVLRETMRAMNDSATLRRRADGVVEQRFAGASQQDEAQPVRRAAKSSITQIFVNPIRPRFDPHP